MLRGSIPVRDGPRSETQSQRSTSQLRSRRSGRRGRHTNRSQLRKQLGLEQLEDRRVLSVYYDIDLVSDVLTAGGAPISGVETDVSVNERGQVAFVGDLGNGDEAILVGNGNGPPANVSSLLGGLGLDYSSPQITGGGEVVVRSETATVGSVMEFDVDLPGSFTRLLVAEKFLANPGTFTDVTLGLRSEDGDVAYLAKSNALAAPGVYFTT